MCSVNSPYKPSLHCQEYTVCFWRGNTETFIYLLPLKEVHFKYSESKNTGIYKITIMCDVYSRQVARMLFALLFLVKHELQQSFKFFSFTTRFVWWRKLSSRVYLRHVAVFSSHWKLCFVHCSGDIFGNKSFSFNALLR